MNIKIITEIERCLQHAAEAIDRATATNDAQLKRSYMDMASRWRALAESFEMVDALSDVNAIPGRDAR